MKSGEFYYGHAGRKYGIWNTARKCWQFGICEDTPMLAQARLFAKIGKDANKWRFEARALPKNAAMDARTPCDLCAFNPASSLDGKPCSLCPAVPRT